MSEHKQQAAEVPPTLEQLFDGPEEENVDPAYKGQLAPYNPIAAGLAEMRATVAAAKWDMSVPKDNRDARQFRSACIALRQRLDAANKSIKLPAQQLIKDANTALAEITEQIKAIEEPVDTAIKAEQEKANKAKREAEAAEQARVDEIKARINAIREVPELVIELSADEIAKDMADLLALDISKETFAEFAAEAQTHRQETLDRLRRIHDRKRDDEQHQAQLAKQREELEKQQREQAARQAELDAREEAERKKREAELAEQQQRIAAEQAERDRKDAERRAELEAAEARIREREQAIETERAEKARQEAEAKAKAEQEAHEAQEAKRRKELEHARRLAEAGRAGYELAKACMEYDQNEARPSFLPIVEMAREIINSVEVAEKRSN